MSADPLSALALAPDRPLAPEELKSCCASVYADPAVRWLLGEELHPGGEATTGRALELLAMGRGDWLLDVASGGGASALKAVRELGCRAVGVEYGETAVLGARAQAEAEGLGDRVSFLRGDAEALPLTSASFDAVLCECSLCTFPDKALALAEMRRVLSPGGRVVISDVTVDQERLPPELLGPLSTIACVGSALSQEGYEGLLRGAGLEPFAVETREPDAAHFAGRVEERLRGARLLGLGRLSGSPIEIEAAIELAGLARRAIAEGSLGYAIIAARDAAPVDG